jgi:hypothetical protein
MGEKMIDEFIKSAKQTLEERLSSPFLSSFAISWVLWNYKFLVILFSDAGVSETFKLIDTVAFPTCWTIFTRGTLFPLVSALIYVFVYPFQAKFIYEFTLNRQREINQAKRNIEGETPLTLEQSKELRAEFVRMESEHQQVIDRLNEEITSLRSALSIESKKVLSKSDRNSSSKEENILEGTQLTLLKEIDDYDGKVAEDILIAGSPTSKVKTEFDIGELERMNLINKTFEDDRCFIEFTHEGRRALLNHENQNK